MPFPVNHIEVPDNIRQAYLANRERRKSPDFRFPNNLIANVQRVELVGDTLHLDENMTDWSWVTGVERGGLLNDLSEAERDRISRKIAPNSCMGIVESLEGNILLAFRNLEGKMSPFPAGHHEYIHTTGNFENPFSALSTESREELDLPLYDGKGVLHGDVKDVYMVGIVRCDNGGFTPWHLATAFVINTKRTDRDLEEGHRSSPDKYEHAELIRVPIDPHSLETFIKERYHEINENGCGALLLYGRYKFGEGWYRRLFHELTTDARYQTVITEGNPFSRRV